MRNILVFVRSEIQRNHLILLNTMEKLFENSKFEYIVMDNYAVDFMYPQIKDSLFPNVKSIELSFPDMPNRKSFKYDSIVLATNSKDLKSYFLEKFVLSFLNTSCNPNIFYIVDKTIVSHTEFNDIKKHTFKYAYFKYNFIFNSNIFFKKKFEDMFSIEVDIPFDFDMIQTFLAFYIVPEESIPTYEFQKYLISYDLDLFAVSRLISLGLLTLNGDCLEKNFMGCSFYEKISLKILDLDFYERVKKIKSPIDYIDKYLISKFSEQSNYSE